MIKKFRREYRVTRRFLKQYRLLKREDNEVLISLMGVSKQLLVGTSPDAVAKLVGGDAAHAVSRAVVARMEQLAS